VIVAGGTYREECQVPTWSRIFGSGARAAAAVSLLSPASKLHAYVCRDWAEDARRSMEAFGVDTVFTEVDPDICFHYFHPLSTAQLSPALPQRFDPLVVRGEFVLRFGFLEGEAIVHADRAVYDPQNPRETFGFRSNGSTAGELAIVLNETQLGVGPGASDWPAVRQLMESTEAQIIVVKRGARGAAVYTNDSCKLVPAFKSETIFKIGSGDVFSAVFSYLWAERRLAPDEAAEGASKAVSKYVASRDVQASLDFGGIGNPVPPNGFPGPIYLAGPFFNLAQRWLIEEVRKCLLALGADVFSPLHDVGVDGGAAAIAARDLEGVRNSRAMLAIVDALAGVLPIY
jgi:pfkB family carbohydrate kinase